MKFFVLPLLANKIYRSGWTWIGSRIFQLLKWGSVGLCLLCLCALLYYGYQVGTIELGKLKDSSALFSALLTGIAAFATLGTLLHLVHEREEGKAERAARKQMLNFELYRKHKDEFRELTKRLEINLSEKFPSLPKCRIRDPEILYHKIFPNNSCFNVELRIDALQNRSLLLSIAEKLNKIHLIFEKKYNQEHYMFHKMVGENARSLLGEVHNCFNALHITPVSGFEEKGAIYRKPHEEDEPTMLNILLLDDNMQLLFDALNVFERFADRGVTPPPVGRQWYAYLCPSVIWPQYESTLAGDISDLYVDCCNELELPFSKAHLFIKGWREAVNSLEVPLAEAQKHKLFVPLDRFLFFRSNLDWEMARIDLRGYDHRYEGVVKHLKDKIENELPSETKRALRPKLEKLINSTVNTAHP
ncbi:MAG: hypothetical protein ACERJ1_17870 [Halodesulfovibrio sp.]|uniref:hypothetical protein n=1 Tax=Halodesulfovibrio sp. TaxID=1912772 RepID=UPI00359E1DB6